MTPTQKRIVLVLSIAIALTRLLAVARSLWDWDEALFSLGVREFDVAVQHPHPPGYPLFIAAAKLFHLFGVNEFRSLQVVVVLGAFCIFPALVWLAHELGFPFATSVCGAALFAFLPNVWIYGGTGFSDVPATAIGFVACALLLRGRRDERAYILGAIVLGIAAGMRTPNLLIGFVPAILATWHRFRARDFRAIAIAIVLGGAITGGSYIGAALASESIGRYREALDHQREWVRKVDSWHNPTRPRAHASAKIFFVRPIQWHDGMNALIALSAVSIVAAAIARRRAPFFTLLMFAPLAIFTWFYLDIGTPGRYAIGYLAVYALLATEGVRVIARKPWVQCVICAAGMFFFIRWTLPALATQRNTDSPPASALHWVARNVPKSKAVYVHGVYGPQSAYMLPDHRVVVFDDDRDLAVTGDAWIVHPDVRHGALNFVRAQKSHLWRVIRQRGFEASVMHLSALVTFGEGWYAQEESNENAWRWMGRESRATLGPAPKAGRLSMRIYVPSDLPKSATVEVWMNGSLVERFAAPSNAMMTKSWVLPSQANAPNDLRITTDEAVTPAHDPRTLGLRVDGLTWTPM